MSALTPSRPVVRRIVELATLAPSVHNTQPWVWRTDGAHLQLYADRSRQLRAEDPVGRNLVISCGAALHHARVAAAALGWATEVTLVPQGPSSSRMATLSFTWAPEAVRSEEIIGLIETRRTDRRRFTSWPVSDEQLQHLAEGAREWGAGAMPIVEMAERFRLERLVQRANDQQTRQHQLCQEQFGWIDHGPRDGVPPQVPPTSPEAARQHPGRFPVGLLDDDSDELEGSDGVLVMYDAVDDLGAWLRAGQGLSALWLRATAAGLSVVPLSRVVEVDETREAVQRDVLGGLAMPLMVVRIGWQAISRSDLPPSPRRQVDEVLDPD